MTVGLDGAVNDGAARAYSWTPVDLKSVITAVQAGETVGPVPTMLLRSDMVPILYPGQVHSIHGEPESMKGWIATHAAVSIIELGGQVLYLDFEDGPGSIVMRLLALGALPEAIIDRFTYVRPDDRFDAVAYHELLKARPYELVIVDGVTEAYGLLGLEIASTDDAAKFLTQIPRRAASTGAAVLEIDHVVKAADSRGRYAIGAGHKLAGVAVAFSTEVITPVSRLDAGLVKLWIEKDRHGAVRGHARGAGTRKVIAMVHVIPADNGDHVTVRLDPPEDNAGDDGRPRPTYLMERISRFVEAATEPPTRNAIKDGVKGKTDYKDQALTNLIREGYVDQRPHGQAKHHYTLKPYRQDEDQSPGPQPVPNQSPGPVEPNRSPGPLPSKGDRGPGTRPTNHNNGNRSPRDPDELQQLVDAERNS